MHAVQRQAKLAEFLEHNPWWRGGYDIVAYAELPLEVMLASSAFDLHDSEYSEYVYEVDDGDSDYFYGSILYTVGYDERREAEAAVKTPVDAKDDPVRPLPLAVAVKRFDQKTCNLGSCPRGW